MQCTVEVTFITTLQKFHNMQCFAIHHFGQFECLNDYIFIYPQLLTELFESKLLLRADFNKISSKWNLSLIAYVLLKED